MRKILIIYLLLDVIYYFYLGAQPGGIFYHSLKWMIPSVLLLGSAMLFWFYKTRESSGFAQEYTFILYVLGSRLLYGSIIGFQFSIISVYVGLMLILSALFFFGHRLVLCLLILQVILLFESSLGALGRDAAMILLVTSVFAASSVALNWERHRTRFQSYLMNRSILEKNTELQQAHQKISMLYDQSSEQLKRTREAEALMKGLLDNTETAMALVDRDGDLKYYNDSLSGISGYGFAELDETLLNDILGEYNVERFIKKLDAVFDQMGSVLVPAVQFQHREGGFRTARVRIDYIDIDGDGYALISIMNITEDILQKERIQQLSRMKDVVLAINHHLYEDADLDHFLDYVLSRVREVMPHADLGCILLLEEESTLVIASSFGYNTEEIRNFRLPLDESFSYRVTGGNFVKTVIINDIQSMLHENYVEILETEDQKTVQSSISGPIIKGDHLYGLINIDSKDNHVYTENDVLIMEYLREQLGLALSRRDLYQEFSYISKHDQLTGFLNRWYLRELETNHVPRWERYGADVCIATMDLNNLKLVNDLLGHHEGDAYIRFFSTFMKNTFRSTDLIIRLGGDEFAGLFFHTPEEELIEKLDAVNQLIAECPLQQILPSIALGFSYGIVRFGEHGKNIEELLQIADKRMYHHKSVMKGEKELF